jgi:hypothetical protein
MQAIFGSEHQAVAVAEAAEADAAIRKEVLKIIVPELSDAYKMDIAYTAGWVSKNCNHLLSSALASG